MISDCILWGGIVLLVYAFYKWATINYDYFEKRGVSYLKPTFLVGNNGGFLFLMKYTMAEFINMMYTANPGYKILGDFDFRRPIVILRDPETIKQVVVKDFDHFEDHQNFIDEKIDVLFGNSLFLMKGNKWREMRATLSPAFTGSKMRLMFDLVSEYGEEMMKTLLKQAEENGSVDCEAKEFFSKYTNDIISSAAFGYKINSFEDPKNDFFVMGKSLMCFTSFKSIIRILFITTLPKLASFFKVSFIDAKVSSFFRSMVLDNMASREKQGIFRPDMINILMSIKGNSLTNTIEEKDKDSAGFATVEESSIGKKNVKREWSDDELVAQYFIFFLAGFDTSSTLLSFLAYELSVNLDIQQKLYEEVEETYRSLGGKPLNYDTLQKMKYMDMVISETLRYWPPLPGIDRDCVKDYDYDDGQCKFKIEKGTYVSIPIYGLHFDEKYWDNPKKFDPERFSDENKDKITPGTYLPFGVGPRNCIGSRFALMKCKCVIYYLLLNFKFEPNAKSQIPLKLQRRPVGMVTEKGIHVSFTPRI